MEFEVMPEISSKINDCEIGKCELNGLNIIGGRIEYLNTVESTNITARNMAEDGVDEGTVVIAEKQTMGQGRLQRKWSSPEGKGLWFSIVLRPDVNPARASQITLLAAVAVAEAIKKITGIKPGIKWPNDLLIGKRKLCGILTEMKSRTDGRVEYIILGIGINVNLRREDLNPEIKDIATSILMERGEHTDRNHLLNNILSAIDYWYRIWIEQGFEPVREKWKENSITIGSEVYVDSWDEKYSGLAVDIDEGGSLLIRTADRDLRLLHSGDVSLLTRS